MFIFRTRPYWLYMRVPLRKGRKRYQEFSGKENDIVENSNGVLEILLNIISTIQNEILFKLKLVNYGDFDVVYFIKETNELFLIEEKYFSD